MSAPFDFEYWDDDEEYANFFRRLTADKVYVETRMGINIYVADDFCSYIVGGFDIVTATLVRDYDLEKEKVVTALYINSKLLNGPKEIYEAVCLHELGHNFSGHLRDDVQDRVLTDKHLKIDLELEADAWAVRHGADAKVLCDFLKDLRDTFITNIGGKENYDRLLESSETVRTLHTECDERIAALSK